MGLIDYLDSLEAEEDKFGDEANSIIEDEFADETSDYVMFLIDKGYADQDDDGPSLRAKMADKSHQAEYRGMVFHDLCLALARDAEDDY